MERSPGKEYGSLYMFIFYLFGPCDRYGCDWNNLIMKVQGEKNEKEGREKEKMPENRIFLGYKC